MQSDIQIFSQFRAKLRVDLENELSKREITELKKAYALVLDLDALKLDYMFRSLDHRTLAFKSILHQYWHRVTYTPTHTTNTTLKTRALKETFQN